MARDAMKFVIDPNNRTVEVIDLHTVGDILLARKFVAGMLKKGYTEVLGYDPKDVALKPKKR